MVPTALFELAQRYSPMKSCHEEMFPASCKFVCFGKLTWPWFSPSTTSKHHRKISTLSLVRFKLELAFVDLIQENEMKPLKPVGTY